jgi:hypothetical protein
MTFKKWSLAIATLMLVAPLSASALGISIAGVSSTGGNVNLLQDGDIITFDLVLENATNEQVQALGLGVYGYDIGAQGNPLDNKITFVGGTQGLSILNTAYVAGLNVNGLTPVGPVKEDGAPFPVSNTMRVSLFEGASAGSPSTGNGTFDNGVAGAQTNGGDVHFQVSFQAQKGSGFGFNEEVTLEFGTGQFGNAALTVGGGQIGFNNDSITFSVVPEPGTALLMGLGLAGLAARKR